MSAKLRLFYRIAKGFALFFLICCIPLVSAEGRLSDNTSVSAGNSAQSIIVPSSSQTPVTNTLVKKTSEDPLLALQIYRQNLTYPRNKIPENLLQIIDPSYPKFGMTPEQVRVQMIASRHLIPAEKAKTRFNITNDLPIGDQVFLTIYVYPNVSTHILDPIVTDVTNRKEKYHFVEAWVDVNNLEKLAALDGVQGMELIVFAEYSGDSVNETSTVFPPPVTTHTTPLSNYVVYGSLVCAGLLVVLLQIQKRGN